MVSRTKELPRHCISIFDLLYNVVLMPDIEIKGGKGTRSMYSKLLNRSEKLLKIACISRTTFSTQKLLWEDPPQK